MSDLPGTMLITRADLGRPVVAVQYDGPIMVIIADHNAPEWMIIAAAILAKHAAEERRSA